jgi:hypothetical protein
LTKTTFAGDYMNSLRPHWLPGRQASLSGDHEHPNDSLESHTADGSEETSIDYGDDWFDDCFEQATEKVELQLAETGKDGTTLARFKLGKQLLACQLGELALARFPLCIARLNYMPRFPVEESGYDQIFLQLLNRKFDGIYLESIDPESSLWRYLQTSRLIQRSFFRYSQRGPSPHLLIRLNGTFSDYLKRLSPKTRKNRLREIRILRELGNLELIRITDVSELDAFLKASYSISLKTRQFKRFGWGVASRDPVLVKNELLRLARQGSLRSYLLTCDGIPCSYILGQKCGTRFKPVSAGVDPTWRNYSAGTVLLFLVLEDLFREPSCDYYDLGDFAAHKEYLATDSYLETDVWLFRRLPYAGLVSSAYRICNLTTKFGGVVFEWLGLKERMVRLMRRID